MGSVRLASLDVDLQLVVNLAQLPDTVTAHELADLLGMTAEDILGALALDANTGICGEFYESVRSAFGSELTFQDGDAKRTLWLPPAAELDQDLEVVKIREVEFVTGTDFGSWPLPISRIVLPWNDEALDELATHLQRVGSKGRIVKVYDSSDHNRTLFLLEALVRKLQGEIEKANARTKTHGGIIAATDKARSVVMLQERHWWSEARKGSISDAEADRHRAKLKLVDDRLLELGEMSVSELRHPRSLQKTAKKLLDMLSATDVPGGGVPGFLDTFEVARWNISAEIRDRFLKALAAGCVAICHSHLAEQFMKAHGLDMIEAFCFDEQKHFQQILNVLESKNLVEELDGKWTETLADLRTSLGAKPFGSSPLAQVAKIAKHTRTAIKISQTILTPATFGRLLSGLRSLGTSANDDARRLATLCTRYLLTPSLPWIPGVSKVASMDELAFAALATQEEERIVLLRALDGADMFAGKDQRLYWKIQGEELAKHRLNERVFKRPGATTLTLSVNLILLAATISSDEDNPYIYTFAMVGAILGTAQAAAGAAAYFVEPRARFFGSSKITNFENSAKIMGRIAGVAGLVASVATLAKHAPTEPTAVIVNDAITVTSGVLGTVAWMAEGTGLLALGSGLGTAAAVLGIVALAGAAVIDVLTPGPLSTLNAYVDFVEADDVGAKFPIEIDAVRSAIRDARDIDTFVDFRTINGKPRIDPYRTSPTLFGAMQLGFNHLEIAKLFSCESAYVAAVLPAEKDLQAAP